MNYIEENKNNTNLRYICEVCGRRSFKKIKLQGYILCSKHMHQLYKYGHFIDNNPRTNNDLNDYRIEGNVVYMDVYNQKNEKNGEFFFDLEDLPKVKYHKWRKNHEHFVTGTGIKNIDDITHIVMNLSREQREKGYVVDHINGNTADNRKSNLRICAQRDNVLNKHYMSTNKSGFIGVTWDSNRGAWASEIRHSYKRIHLGRWKLLSEAVFVRYIAEIYLFDKYRCFSEGLKKKTYIKESTLTLKKMLKIKNYVINKISSKI